MTAARIGAPRPGDRLALRCAEAAAGIVAAAAFGRLAGAVTLPAPAGLAEIAALGLAGAALLVCARRRMILRDRTIRALERENAALRSALAGGDVVPFRRPGALGPAA